MSDNAKSLRTSMGRVRGLGPARSGTGHFWLQRVTAVANVFLSIAFVVILVKLAGRDYAGAHALLGQPLVAVLIALFVISGCVHMRLGMQVVIEDYVHGEGAKIAAVVGNTFFTILIAAASLFAILKLASGN